MTFLKDAVPNSPEMDVILSSHGPDFLSKSSICISAHVSVYEPKSKYHLNEIFWLSYDNAKVTHNLFSNMIALINRPSKLPKLNLMITLKH